MSVDVFKARELTEIAGLAKVVEDFNKDQYGDTPLFGEVVFYRDGEKVAGLVEALVHDGSASKGDLRFEVEVNT